MDINQGPVVQSWISVNPGLKFNPLFWFVYFCTSAYFKTSEKKTPFDPGGFLKEYVQVYKQAVGKFALNF